MCFYFSKVIDKNLIKTQIVDIFSGIIVRKSETLLTHSMNFKAEYLASSKIVYQLSQ